MSTTAMSSHQAARPQTLAVLPPGEKPMKRSRSYSSVEDTPKRTIVRHTRYIRSGSTSDVPRPSLLGFICSGAPPRRASCSAAQRQSPRAAGVATPTMSTMTMVRRSSTSARSTESLTALMDPAQARRERRAGSMDSTTSNCSMRSVTGRSVRTPISGAASPAIKRRAGRAASTGSEAAAAAAAAVVAAAAAVVSESAAGGAVLPPVARGGDYYRGSNMRGSSRMGTPFMDRVAHDIPHHLEELERQLGLTSSMSSFSTVSTLDVDSADLNTTRLDLEMELEDTMFAAATSDSFEEPLTDAELSHVSHAITRATPKLSSDEELDIRYQRLVAWANEAAKGEKPKPSPITEPEVSMEMFAKAASSPWDAGYSISSKATVDEPAILADGVIARTLSTCPTLIKRQVSLPSMPFKTAEAVVELQISPTEIPQAHVSPASVVKDETGSTQVTLLPEQAPDDILQASLAAGATRQELRSFGRKDTSQLELFERENSPKDGNKFLPSEAIHYEISHREIVVQEISPHIVPQENREVSPPEFTEISEDQENWNRVDPALKIDMPIESTCRLAAVPTALTFTTRAIDDIYSSVRPAEAPYRELCGLDTGATHDLDIDRYSAYAEGVAVVEEEVIGVAAPVKSRLTMEERLTGVEEADVWVIANEGAATGMTPAGSFPTPPSPPPSPGEMLNTASLSSATGSTTTISTTGLLETQFSDSDEVRINVQVIPEEGDAHSNKSDEEFYNFTQQYDSLPGYYPCETDAVDSPVTSLPASMHDAYSDALAALGESTYMGESVSEDWDWLPAPEPAEPGGGGSSTGSPARTRSHTDQRHLLEEEEEEGQQQHTMEEPYFSLQERLCGTEERGSGPRVNSDLAGQARGEEAGGATPHPDPAGTARPGAGPALPGAGAPHDIPTDTPTPTAAAEVKQSPPGKPRLKGILKKTSSFDVKGPEKKLAGERRGEAAAAGQPRHAPGHDSDSDRTLPADSTGGAQTPSATGAAQPETEQGHTDTPNTEDMRRRRPRRESGDIVTSSFPSLSDVIHAKSFDPGVLDVRTRLTLLDAVINFLLLTPLTVLFYYATCRLLQMSLLRMLPMLGPWLLLLLGGTIEFTASFCQRPIAARAPKPEVGRPPFADVNLLFLLAAKGFNLVLAFGNVCHMLAMSDLVDLYVGAGFGVGLRVAMTSLVVLWTLRCGRNVIAPPLYVGIDPDDLGVFASTTMFRVEPDMSVESAADILGTTAVMTSFVHLHWAGVWNCADALLFPTFFAISMLTSLLLGSALCLLFLLLQQPAEEISRNLERQSRALPRVAFENVFNTTANVGVVLLWRGLWMVYDLMADYFPIYCRSWDITPLAACALSFLLLALAHCSSSLLFRGCEVDGELRGGAGVRFTTGYFTEILQGPWHADSDASESAIRPTPAKPVAASSAITSLSDGTSETTLVAAAATEQTTSSNGSTPTLHEKSI